MIKITYVEHGGTKHEVEAEAGSSLMQVALDNVVHGIVGDCGGACSCATCHCYIDESWIGKIGAAEGEELDMLECAIEPNDRSRLSCQVEVTEEMDGLVIQLPEAQF